MRKLLLALSILGGCCNDDEEEAPAPAATAQQLLQECVAPHTVDLVGLLRRLEAAASGDLSGVVRVTGVDLVRATVEFTVDVDGDLSADARGALRFEDAAGRPTVPFDPLLLLTNPASAFGAIADGTVAVLDWEILEGGAGAGTARYRFEGGVATSVSGEGTFERGPCGIEFTLDGADPATATLAFVVAAGRETVTGSVEILDAATARIRARVDSGAEQTFLLDLATGALAPA
jgi:hypothetical protein